MKSASGTAFNLDFLLNSLFHIKTFSHCNDAQHVSILGALFGPIFYLYVKNIYAKTLSKFSRVNGSLIIRSKHQHGYFPD